MPRGGERGLSFSVLRTKPSKRKSKDAAARVCTERGCQNPDVFPMVDEGAGAGRGVGVTPHRKRRGRGRGEEVITPRVRTLWLGVGGGE